MSISVYIQISADDGQYVKAIRQTVYNSCAILKNHFCLIGLYWMDMFLSYAVKKHNLIKSDLWFLVDSYVLNTMKPETLSSF